jgi:hypothetical protein
MKPQKRTGRPPRTDRPIRSMLVLPGELRTWLRAQAKREERDMSALVVDALERYRRAVRRRPL